MAASARTYATLAEEIAAPRLFARRHRYYDEYDVADSEFVEDNVQWPSGGNIWPFDNDVYDHIEDVRSGCPFRVYGGPHALPAAGSVEHMNLRRHRYVSSDSMEEDLVDALCSQSASSSRQGLPREPFTYCDVARADAPAEGRVYPSATPVDPGDVMRAVDVYFSATVRLTAAAAVRTNNDKRADEHSLSAAPGPTARISGHTHFPSDTRDDQEGAVVLHQP